MNFCGIGFMVLGALNAMGLFCAVAHAASVADVALYKAQDRQARLER